MTRFPVLRGIRGKLLLTFSLLLTAIATFVLMFFPASLERQAMRSTVQKAEVIGEMTAYSLRAGLMFGDTAAIQEVLAGATRNGDARFLTLRDTAGREIASHGEHIPRFGRPGTIITLNGTEQVLVSAVPVKYAGARLGSLTLGLSLASLQAEVRTARRLGAVVALLILIMGLVIVYAISTLVTRPLTEVAGTVRRIAAGDFELRAVEPPDAEVGQLVQAFNHMVDSLVGAQAELSVINQELEGRVEVRTQALRTAMVEQTRVQSALTRSESQARATTQMLQSLIDVAPQAIVAVDMDWRVSRWNHASEALFGWTADEAIGETLPFIGRDELDEFREYQSTMQSGRRTISMETARLRKNGTRVTVLLSVGLMRDADDKPTGYIGIATDLTERKSLEEQLRHSQKMEAVGRLAGGVAHDFNNILTVITSCSEMLLEEITEGQNREDLEAIASSAMRAKALTRQLLLFSRKQVINLQPISVTEVVTGMEPMLRRLLRENIRLSCTQGGGIGHVRADPTQLEQVIMNLVVNASDAMPQGGALTVDVRRSEPQDLVGDVPPGAYVVLRVSDTGVGMDGETMSKIFEPFYTTKAVGEGTGLGLATTYAVVSQLDGHIRVVSAPGRGTTFSILLPELLSEQGTTAAMTTTREIPIAGQARTVLLVEDEDSVRRTIKRMLERQGYIVLEAGDGETGLSIASAHPDEIDLVITDFMMPGMNGREFANQLTVERPGLPVLFISGYTGETVSHHELFDSTHTFLQKPFTGTQLARAMHYILGETGETATTA
jgi:PAS domain S-box-containing protein